MHYNLNDMNYMVWCKNESLNISTAAYTYNHHALTTKKHREVTRANG